MEKEKISTYQTEYYGSSLQSTRSSPSERTNSTEYGSALNPSTFEESRGSEREKLTPPLRRGAGLSMKNLLHSQHSQHSQMHHLRGRERKSQLQSFTLDSIQEENSLHGHPADSGSEIESGGLFSKEYRGYTLHGQQETTTELGSTDSCDDIMSNFLNETFPLRHASYGAEISQPMNKLAYSTVSENWEVLPVVPGPASATGSKKSLGQTTFYPQSQDLSITYSMAHQIGLDICEEQVRERYREPDNLEPQITPTNPTLLSAPPTTSTHQKWANLLTYLGISSHLLETIDRTPPFSNYNAHLLSMRKFQNERIPTIALQVLKTKYIFQQVKLKLTVIYIYIYIGFHRGEGKGVPSCRLS